MLRGGSSKDERSARHQAVMLAPQRSITTDQLQLPLTALRELHLKAPATLRQRFPAQSDLFIPIARLKTVDIYGPDMV